MQVTILERQSVFSRTAAGAMHVNQPELEGRTQHLQTVVFMAGLHSPSKCKALLLVCILHIIKKKKLKSTTKNTKPNNKNTPMLQFLFLFHFHHVSYRSPILTESIRSHILYGNGWLWLKMRSSAGVGSTSLPPLWLTAQTHTAAMLLLQQWDKLHRIQTSNGKIPKCRFIPVSVFTFKTAQSLLENSYDNITFPICC